MKKGLIILQIDGLSCSNLNIALRHKKVKFIKKLLSKKGYKMVPFRSGLPSVTPAVQAGILYGDNREIPSFRWFDKKSKLSVRFGPEATFKKVAFKYFKGLDSLVKGGACIGACFPAQAKETFALAYKRTTDGVKSKNMRYKLFIRWIINPFHSVDWIYHSILIILRVFVEYSRVTVYRKQIAPFYLLGHLLDELFLHHLTRYATGLAIEAGYPVIFSVFYTYDETSHAFGPRDSFSLKMLDEIDNTVKYIFERRLVNSEMEYDLIILSDHGQIDSVPIKKSSGKELREIIGDFLPNYKVEDDFGMAHKNILTTDGHVFVSSCGGLAHVYFTDYENRLNHKDIESNFPGFITRLSKIKEIGSILVKDGEKSLLIIDGKKFDIKNNLDIKAEKYLKNISNDTKYLSKQIIKLNAYNACGDLILFGKYRDKKEINFEFQIGGHGSMGGGQMDAFILLKKEWENYFSSIDDSTQLCSSFKRLKLYLTSQQRN